MKNCHPSKTNVNLCFAPVDIGFLGVTIYIYHMASRVTYQNINPEVTQKPWQLCHPMPKGFRVTEGLMFWYIHPRRHVIYVKLHFQIKRKLNLMEHTAPRFLFRSSIYFA